MLFNRSSCRVKPTWNNDADTLIPVIESPQQQDLKAKEPDADSLV